MRASASAEVRQRAATKRERACMLAPCRLQCSRSHQKLSCPAGGGGGGLSCFEHGMRSNMSPPSCGVVHPGSHTHSSYVVPASPAAARASSPCGPHSSPEAGEVDGGGASVPSPSQCREMKLKMGYAQYGQRRGRGGGDTCAPVGARVAALVPSPVRKVPRSWRPSRCRCPAS